MPKTENMYAQAKTWNPFKGCEFDCIYCTPSFQRQSKRQKNLCGDCYAYSPHCHETVQVVGLSSKGGHDRTGALPNNLSIYGILVKHDQCRNDAEEQPQEEPKPWIPVAILCPKCGSQLEPTTTSRSR